MHIYVKGGKTRNYITCTCIRTCIYDDTLYSIYIMCIASYSVVTVEATGLTSEVCCSCDLFNICSPH